MTLNEVYGLTESDFDLAYCPMGKPYLSDHSNIHLNISHCDSVVVCACGDSPMGIDVEEPQMVSPALLRRVLSPDEQNAIAKLSSDVEKSRRFAEYWTVKESYFKFRGTGITDEISLVSGESLSLLESCIATQNMPSVKPAQATAEKPSCLDLLKPAFWRTWLTSSCVVSLCSGVDELKHEPILHQIRFEAVKS